MPDLNDLSTFYDPKDPGTFGKVPPRTDADSSDAGLRQQQQKLISSMEESQSKLEAEAKQTQEERMRLVQSLPTGGPIPKLGNIQQSPKQDFTEPIKAFQNPAVFIATLGSLFSRAPMTAALNAGGAAMEAYHKGEAEEFKLKAEEWKMNTEKVIAQNNVELDKYRAVMENKRLSTQQKLAEMNAIAAGFSDQMKLEAGRNGNYKMLYDMYESQIKSNYGLRKSVLDWDQRMAVAQEHSRATLEAAKIRAKGDGAAGFSDQAINDSAERYLKTGILPPMGWKGQAARTKILNKASELAQDRGINMAEQPKEWQKFKASQVAIQRFESGQQGNTIRSLNVVTMHLGTLRELAAALDSGNYPRFNSIAQQWSKETGLPAPTNFDTATRFIGPEVIKALGVGNVGTGEERQNMSDSFKRTGSPTQIVGGIDTVARPLLGGQLKGLKQQFLVATQLPESDFNAMLDPSTVKFMGGKAGKAQEKLEWMERARAKNPSASDEELSDFYDKNKGGK